MSGVGRLVRWLEVGWIDVALALGLSALAIAIGPGGDGEQFSPAVLLCTAPLVFRRRAPIAVLLLALVGFSIAGNASNLPALAGGLIAALSIGLDPRNALFGAVAVLIAAIAIAVEFGHGDRTELPIPAYLAPFLLIGSAYLAGRAIVQQRQRADQAERDHAAAVRAATQDERRRIARELHDVIAHSVGVMVVQAGAARHVLATKPDAAEESLVAVETSGHEAMAELRRLLGVLADNGEEASLSPQPGVEKLPALIARVREAGLPVELSIVGDARPLPPGVDVAGYRIVQEALTNALKYAGGAATRAVVKFGADSLDIDVEDDGRVATPSDGIGRGLTGMRERVAMFGGSIDAGPRAAGGYAVHAHLPIESPE